MRWIWVVVAVAVVSCKSSDKLTPPDATRADAAQPPPLDAGDAPPADEPPASGTRLRLTWVDFDGTRTHPGIFDSQLARACTARTWVDGEDYCTPETKAGLAFQYEDDQCTKVVVDAGLPIGALVFTIAESPAVPCLPTAISGVYEVGDQITNAELYEVNAGSCIRVAIGQTVQRTVPVAKSSFVRLGHAHGSAPTRLVRQWITSSDGLRLPDGFFDRELAAACSFEVGDDRLTGRCMPANHHTAFGFLDANCQTPATFQNPSACTVPTFVLPEIDLTTTCAVTLPTVHRPGSAIDHFFEQVGTSCRERPLMPSQIAVALGPPLELVQSQRVRDPQGPRITHMRHQTASGVLEDPDRLFDHVLGIECTAKLDLIAGAFRCVPADFVRTARSGFADASCQTPMIELQLGQGPTGCPVPNPGTYVSGDGTNFFMHVEGVYTAPFYVDFVGCSALPTPELTARYRATRVDPSLFTTGVTITE